MCGSHRIFDCRTVYHCPQWFRRGLWICKWCSARKQFCVVFDVMMETAFTSIHRVKYLTATNAYLRLPWTVGSGLTMSIPHRCSGQVGATSFDFFEAPAPWLVKTSSRLCNSMMCPGHPSQFQTKKNLGVWFLKRGPWSPCDSHKILYGLWLGAVCPCSLQYIWGGAKQFPFVQRVSSLIV